MELILDTNFIIAIERESRRNLQAESHEFLKTHFDKNLWIAATAITHGMGVVTRNQKEFQKIKNLEIATF